MDFTEVGKCIGEIEQLIKRVSNPYTDESIAKNLIAYHALPIAKKMVKHFDSVKYYLEVEEEESKK